MNADGLIIDCFAGGGGASTGIELALGRSVDIAVNHDPKAIAMHRANHPSTYHVTEDIFEADLKSLVAGRHVSLMWASPDCTHHSRAKGGRPRESGLRMLPWAVHKHASDILPDVIIMENVPEIQKWGPLGEDGRPNKQREGEEYSAFVAAMKRLGYTFSSRELAACDYGAPTTRKRWYAVLRRDGRKTEWPSPTHGRTLFAPQPYIPASSCIDFSDFGTSIFRRKKPLADATMNRIVRGIEKYVLCDDPFLVETGNGFEAAFVQKHYTGVVRQDAREPLHTITAGFNSHFSIVACHLTKFYHTGIGQSLNEPMHTITTSAGHFGLVSAFLVKYYGSGTGQPATAPLGTITTKDRFGLVTVEIDGEAYAIADIWMRMLKPRELMLAQGFPGTYVIDRYSDGSAVPVAQQVKMIGNSVVPIMAKAIVSANCPYLAVGGRSERKSA